MSTGRWGVLAGIFLTVLAFGAYGLMMHRPSVQNVVAPERSKPAVSPSGRIAVADPPAAESIAVSTRLIDFGRLPVRFSDSETLFVLSPRRVSVRVASPGLSEPFRLGRESFELDPGVSAGLAITFAPDGPGVYEQRLALQFGSPLNEIVRVVVRGTAIPSPADAGVEIPAPPDLSLRRHREEEIERALREASQFDATRRDGIEGQEDGDDRASRDSPPENGVEGRDGESREPSGGGGLASTPPAVIAAFGLALDRANDINNVPAPIPEGETIPDLPPPDGQDDQDIESKQQPDGGSDAGAEEATGDPAEESPAAEASSKPKRISTFTIAPNSSILVYSSREPLSLQTFPLRVSPDRGAFEMHGRIRFPQLAMAFGQTVGVRQFGDIIGILSPEGNMQLTLTLRLEDPNGNVLDLPVPLTTGMAVGYSAEGRVMFANGIPWNSISGDVKLVGIANVPLGEGSSLDKAPVYLEILGRLEL